MPDLVPSQSVPIALDPAFDLAHVRLARAACLRIEGADLARARIWNFHSDGTLGSRAEHTWDQVSDEYLGPETDPRPLRCAIVLGSEPARWDAEVDLIDVGGHAAIVSRLDLLCDARIWGRLRCRPHAVIATADPHGPALGAALVTRGRRPSDRQLRLILV